MGDKVQKSKARRHVCELCHQAFVRPDHLQRHRLIHSGVRPYECTFCHELFARCDGLRKHYALCTDRGSHPIPGTDQPGRKKHACDPCAVMKLRCEGSSPCSSCKKRGTTCTRTKTQTKKESSSKSPTLKADQERIADIGSIRFLLNAGEAGFIADWQMPDGSIHSRPAAANLFGSGGNADAIAHAYDTPGAALFDPLEDQTCSQIYQAFVDGPFAMYRQQWTEPADQVDAFFERAVWPMGEETKTDWAGNLVTRGLDDVVAAALINVLTTAVTRMGLDTQVRQSLKADIQFLMVPSRIRRFIDSYKTIWHLNCPILHVASLAPETVQMTLLVPIVLMGAMYTADEHELAAAKSLLDVAELYCFSSDVLSPDSEIRLALQEQHAQPAAPMSDWVAFQQFQGAYLMVAVQYWAGNAAARNRAMECRFSEIIKVVRRLNLHNARHEPGEELDEDAWIQKESMIRTMTILFCLDCAFLFFRSFPCRLSFTEVDFEFPCEEPIFNHEHPFQHADFGERRAMSVKQGIQALSSDKIFVGRATSAQSKFTMLGMFTLIHVLYALISNRLSIPFLTVGSKAFKGESFLTKIRMTLQRWLEYWEEVIEKTSTEAWQMAGLFRNGHKYWMVAELLVQKHEQVEGDVLMVPKCEDKWARLRALT